jgi:fructuronate reductase
LRVSDKHSVAQGWAETPGGGHAATQAGIPRLGPETAARLPDAVRRPGYDRTRLQPGIVHIGAGAFHRCHQAEYTDDALEASFGPWGIVGVNLRPPDLQASLGDQNGLYCRELREGPVRDRRLVGSLVRTQTVLGSDYDPYRLTLAKALAAAADPAIRVISLTVTEKGYCHTPATGELDLSHPDVVHDIAHPDTPVSAPGFVLAVLALRFARNLPQPAIISCDNVPDNGSTLGRSVLGLAAAQPALHDHVAREATFLSTMVDRIVPATRDDDIHGFAAETACYDYGLVVGEPFRMWVIEDRHGGPMPAWDQAGALFVPDVAPYEILKMRVVNGIQSNLCQLGVLSGIRFMSEVMAEEVFSEFALRTIEREVALHLPAVPGIDLSDYIATTIRRLRNPALQHETLQISTDGSQKIRQRLLEPVRAALRHGTGYEGLLLGVAGWIQYASGIDWRGEALDVRDPFSATTRSLASEAGGDPERLVDGFLRLEAIFGTDLAENTAVKHRLAAFVAALQKQPSRAVVREFMAGRL